MVVRANEPEFPHTLKEIQRNLSLGRDGNGKPLALINHESGDDLLDALRSLVEWCMDVEENGETYQNTNIGKAIVFSKARLAIAKAVTEKE